MGMSRGAGIDFTLLDPPPLRRPPLSLIDLALPLIDVDDMQAAAQAATERAASARAAGDDNRAALMDQWHSDVTKRLAEIDRWEGGFTYLPELGNAEAMEIFVEGSTITEAGLEAVNTNIKSSAETQTPSAWYDPFDVVARDIRSSFGLRADSYTERAARAQRALVAHEPWQAEHEFWTGAKVPTNFHLSASPSTPTAGTDRTIDAWDDPDPAPGTVLGTAVGISKAAAALDQAIADEDAGVGMLHCTPYLAQLWATGAPARYVQGQLYTINGNLIVPGYGYPGTGPDAARSVDDAVTNTDTSLTSTAANFTYRDVGATVEGDGIPAGTTIATVTDEHTVVLSHATTATATGVTVAVSQPRNTGGRYQWAYVTDMVYKCRGPMRTLPGTAEEMAPAINVSNSEPVRAERKWALITNRLLRAAVLVDTQTA